MENRGEAALGLHGQGFNCAQSVAGAFCAAHGLPQAHAMKLAGGFGGGMRAGQVCGAASGAVMVIGMRYAQTEPGDSEAKQLCYEKTQEFLQAFEAAFGGLSCPALLGCDITTEAGDEQMRRDGLKEKVCSRLITGACDMLQARGF